MTSWVYLFSRFTPEALLFEALALFLLWCGYAAFWVLRKRKYGSIHNEMPSGPVQSYLNELIGNAEQLRVQLFGLLSSKNFTPTQAPQASPDTAAVSSDPDAAKKLAVIEAKMAAQTKALETAQSDKSQLEKALAEAKAAAGGGAPAANPELEQAAAQLKEKVSELEGRLAEYNVIEDDLANLKRLQQENSQLKAQIAKGGGTVETPTLEDPSSAAAPAAEASAPASESPADPSAAELPAADQASAAPAGDPSADMFAGLVEPVESSLQESPAAAGGPDLTPAPMEPEPTEAAPAAAAAPDTLALGEVGKTEGDKSEADLVAEFEKMLKG